MCLRGDTVVDPAFNAWGAGIGVSLNQVCNSRSAYDAVAHGVAGFHVTITGSTGGNPLRFNFTRVSDSQNVISPFVEVAGGPGTYDALISQAAVPSTWNPPYAGTRPDPNAIYSFQVML